MFSSDKNGDATLTDVFEFLHPNLAHAKVSILHSNTVFIMALDALVNTLTNLARDGSERQRAAAFQTFPVLLLSLINLKPALLSSTTLRLRNNVLCNAIDLACSIEKDTPIPLDNFVSEASERSDENIKSLQSKSALVKVVRAYPQKLSGKEWAQVLECFIRVPDSFHGDDAELVKSQLQSLFCDNPRIRGREFANMCQGVTLCLPNMSAAQKTQVAGLMLDLSKLRAAEVGVFWTEFEQLLEQALGFVWKSLASYYCWARADPEAAAMQVPRRLYELLTRVCTKEANHALMVSRVIEEVVETEGFDLAQDDWGRLFGMVEAAIAMLAVHESKKLANSIFEVMNIICSTYLGQLHQESVERYLEMLRLMIRLTTNQNHQHGLLEFIIFVASAITKMPQNSSLWSRCMFPLRDALLPVQMSLAATAFGVLQTIVSDNSEHMSRDSWRLLLNDTLLPAVTALVGEYSEFLPTVNDVSTQVAIKNHELMRLGLNTLYRVMFFAAQVDSALLQPDRICELLALVVAVPSTHISSEVPPLLKATLQLPISHQHLQLLLRGFTDWVAKHNARGQSLLELIDILSSIMFEKRCQQSFPSLFPLCMGFGAALLYSPAAEFSAFTSATHNALSAFVRSTVRLVYFDSAAEALPPEFVEAVPELFWAKIVCQKTNFLAIMHLKNLFEELSGVETRMPGAELARLINAMARVLELINNAHYHTHIVNNQECIYLIFLDRLQLLVDNLVSKTAIEHLVALVPICVQHLAMFNPGVYAEGPLVLLVLLKEFEITCKLVEFYVRNIVVLSAKDSAARNFDRLLSRVVVLSPQLDAVSNRSGTEFCLRMFGIVEREVVASTAQTSVQCLLLFRSFLRQLCEPDISSTSDLFRPFAPLFVEAVRVLVALEMDLDMIEELENTLRTEHVTFRCRGPKEHLILVLKEVSGLTPLIGGRNETVTSYFDNLYRRCLVADPQSPRNLKRRNTADFDRKQTFEQSSEKEIRLKTQSTADNLNPKS